MVSNEDSGADHPRMLRNPRWWVVNHIPSHERAYFQEMASFFSVLSASKPSWDQMGNGK